MRSGLQVLVALLLLTLAPFAQQHTKRLILKDGGFQPITEYKIDGDRVRYFSAERFMWEEMPKDIVDWAATEKYNANPVKNDRSQENRELAEEEARERAKSEADAPTIAPGLRLPDADLGGVYLLDQWQGHPELAEIVQNGADVAKNTGKNAARVTINPLATKHQTFTLQGAHARVQSHVPAPTIFVCLQSGEKSVDVASHYRIAQVESDAKKNARSVGTLNVKMSGKTSQSQRFLPSTAAKVNEGPWIKVTPSQPLAPGEYAVIEMLGEGDMNLFVWDFGVNPDAPENLNASKPTLLRPSAND
jgi:hypothetical protein